MSGHAAGRLIPSEYLDNGQIGLLTEANQIIVGATKLLRHEDARRLAACWNMLRSFTTEQIEKGELDLVKLTFDRDALLTALNDILVAMEASGGWDGDEEVFEAGTKAYDKATGSAA